VGVSKYPQPNTLRWDRPHYDDDKFTSGDGDNDEGKEGSEADETEDEDEEDEFDDFAPKIQEDQVYIIIYSSFDFYISIIYQKYILSRHDIIVTFRLNF